MRVRLIPVALVVSTATTAVLFLLEMFLPGGFPQGAPWMVFLFMAVTAFIATSALLWGLREFSKRKLLAMASFLVMGLAVLAWSTMFIDQLPCFLGGKGC